MAKAKRELENDEFGKSFSKKYKLLSQKTIHNREKLYSCSICDCSYSMKDSLVRHMRTHAGKKPYRCSVCKSSFSKKGHLSNHIRTHTGEKPYSCRVCGYSCSVKESLVIHMRTHTGEKPYSCSVCRYSCSVKGSIVIHMRTHTGEKPYSCSVCKSSFSQKGHLRTHMKTHTGVKSYSCIVCEYSCFAKGSLVIHMRTHTGEKPYSCSECEYSSSRKSRLVSHKQTHTGEKPYNCSACEYSTFQKGSLVTHMRTHTGERPYSCSVCESSFSKKANLVRHMQAHTGKKSYSCSVCESSFFSNAHLVTHMRTHTGEKPYKCSECEYASSLKSKLVIHMKTHTDEKPFSCSVCKSSFSRKAHLVTHMRTHTGEKPSSCSVLLPSFSGKQHLVPHMKAHTGKRSYMLPVGEKAISHHHASVSVAGKTKFSKVLKSCIAAKHSKKTITDGKSRICSEYEKIGSERSLPVPNNKNDKVSLIMASEVITASPSSSTSDSGELYQESCLNIEENKSLFDDHFLMKQKFIKVSLHNNNEGNTLQYLRRNSDTEHGCQAYESYVTANDVGAIEEIEYPCNLCKHIFPTRYSLLQHKVTHAVVRLRKSNLNVKTNEPKLAGYSHHQQKLRRAIVQVKCSSSGDSKIYITDTVSSRVINNGKEINEESYDLEEIEYPCNLCKQIFSARYFLLQHKVTHAVVRLQKCDLNVETNEPKVAGCSLHQQN